MSHWHYFMKFMFFSGKPQEKWKLWRSWQHRTATSHGEIIMNWNSEMMEIFISKTKILSAWKRKTAKGPIIPITDHCTTTHLKMCSTHRETIWRVPKLLLMLLILIKYNLSDVEDWKKTFWISVCSFLHRHPGCWWCWWCWCTGCPKKNALSEFSRICLGTKFFGYFELASLQPSF